MAETKRKLSFRNKNCPGWIWARKFKLLMWKNLKVQFRNKIHTAVEIFIPLVFMSTFGVLRFFMPVTHFQEPTIFTPFDVRTVPSILKTSTNTIFYTPSTPYWDGIIADVKTNYFDRRRLDYTFVAFSSEESMVEAYVNSSRGFTVTKDYFGNPIVTSPALAGIVFPHVEQADNIEFTLRFPAFQRTEYELFSERMFLKPSWFTETLYPIFTNPGPRSGKNDGGFPGYYEEGFLYLQNAIERSIMKTWVNETEQKSLEEYNVQLQRFPYPAYTEDKFTSALQVWFCYFLCFAYLYPVMSITKSIVHEKECRLKEYMKIMGLPNWLHWTAWFVKSFILLGIASALLLMLVKLRLSGQRSILTETDSFLIMTVLMCHSITVIGFSFLLSTLFATANAAATTAGFIWGINFIPFALIFPRINMMTRLWKYASCFLLGNIPASYVCYIFAMFEGSGKGVQWENIMEGVTPDDSFSIFDAMVMMLVNAGVCMVAGFYIELVWPGKYGVPLPWYFPFTKWYWIDGVQQEPLYEEELADMKSNTEFFEADPPHLSAGIHIKGLKKVFGTNVAVNNLELKLFENQVTALLGHNGAGKTTTMSMLTGLVTPTSGTAIVSGFDICKDMSAVRGSLGLCPQYNVLFDELTVEEHIKFFSLLKGYSDSKANQEADRMIEILGFESKRHAQSHTLSGGMKRKLSVGIAFCAGSKAVLLDEPTSGMDPGARRSTWDLIQSEKFGRTVILSTHFMEEADLLGDRIAIMAEGSVRCCGRSLFLKKKYGGFHNLIIVKKPECVQSQITKFLQNKIDSIQIKDDIGAELSYSLPDDQSSKFAELFDDLEKSMNDLNISSFGVGNTTMEEVFMRAGKIHDDDDEADEPRTAFKEDGKYTKNPLDLDNPETPMIRKSFEADGPRYEGLELTIQQLKTVFLKKILFLLRNPGLATLQIFIPVAALTLAMMCFKSLPGLTTPMPFRVSLERYEFLGRTVTLTSCDAGNKMCEGYRNFVSSKYETEDFSNGTLANIFLEKATSNLRYADSKIMVGLEQTMKNTSKGEVANYVAFFNNQPFHNPPIALNFVTNGILRALGIKKEISVVNHPFDYTNVDSIKQAGNVFTLGFFCGWTIEFVLGVMGAAFVIFPVHERMIGAKHLQFVAGLKTPIFYAGSVLIDIFNYMLPCVLMLIILIMMNIQQFHDLEVIMWFLILCFVHGWCMISMMALFSFVFTIPASGFARMTLLNSASGLAAMVMILALENPELGLIELAKTLHDVFIFIPNYALGMGILQITVHHDLKDVCGNFNLESMCQLDQNFICCRKFQDTFYAWEVSGIGKNLLSLFCFGIVFFLMVFCIENHVVSKISSLCRRTNYSKLEARGQDDEPEDEDVIKEGERINSTSLNNMFKTDNLVLRNVKKVYNGKFMAVKKLNLGVPKGETFGLLGVNGAGKTTLFKMITGDIPITSGDIYLCNNSVRKDLAQVYKNLGYCPQFDALIDQLTGRETIRMFANLIGIKETHIDRITNNLAEKLLFTRHIDKKVGAYSGGNKRKLSTAVAMLGNPSVVFFDEPTTGLDPVARRHVWNAVNHLRESGTSVVITSHSMEECEALCSRLGIMVDGRFRCLGSPQHLKNKFGEGYSIVAQLSYSSNTSSKIEDNQLPGNLLPWEYELQGLKDFIKSHFPDCELKDSHPGFVQYYVPGKNTKWAKIFAVMEKAKEDFKLDAYSVGQTSLEQVFFNFTTLSKSYEA